MGVLPDLPVLWRPKTTCNSHLQYSWLHGHRRTFMTFSDENFKGTWSMKIYSESFRNFRRDFLPSKKVGVLGFHEKSVHRRRHRRGGPPLRRVARLLLFACPTGTDHKLHPEIYLPKINHPSHYRETLQSFTLRALRTLSFGRKDCWKTYVLKQHAKIFKSNNRWKIW